MNWVKIHCCGTSEWVRVWKSVLVTGWERDLMFYEWSNASASEEVNEWLSDWMRGEAIKKMSKQLCKWRNEWMNKWVICVCNE